MPSPTGWSSVVPVSQTGLQTIDALLDGTRWASSTITYSFPGYGSLWSTSITTGYGPSFGGREPWSASFSPLSSPGSGDDQVYFSGALQEWANVASLQFVQVADTSTDVGDIRAAYTYQSDQANSQAWAYVPADAAIAGDIWFNSAGASATDYWTPGNSSYFAVLHELGHVLGLKHPFEGPLTLPSSWDSQSFTIMSYSAQPGVIGTKFSFYPTTPMLLDIAAIQQSYGPNSTYHAQDDSYSYSDSATYHETIWDAGGTDTIQYTGSRNSSIDLREGHGSTIGLPVFVRSASGSNLDAVKNVWLAYGAVIENAVAGDGNDLLTGNDGDNTLVGSAGNDTLDGGAGADSLNGGAGDDTLGGDSGEDIAVYSGLRSEYSIAYDSATGVFIVTSQAEGRDTLSGIESLAFSDTVFALTTGGAFTLSGKVYFWNKVAPREPIAAGHVLLDGVTVSADDAGVAREGATTSGGAFSVASIAASTAAVAVSLAVSSADKATVTLGDALEVLTLYLGKLSSPSPYEVLASDFNGDNKVTLSDALGILKSVLNKAGALEPAWVFVDEEANLTGLSKDAATRPTVDAHPVATDASLNLVAVLHGDANGSWKPPSTSSYEVLPDSYFNDPTTGLVAQHPDTMTLGQFGL